MVEKNRSIMVVDDDPDITLFFREVLQSSGLSVDTYNDPLEALSNFKPKIYDLLFVDIRMPRMNGFELIKRIGKKDPSVRVCFMTAFETYYEALKEEHPTLNTKCF